MDFNCQKNRGNGGRQLEGENLFPTSYFPQGLPPPTEKFYFGREEEGKRRKQPLWLLFGWGGEREETAGVRKWATTQKIRNRVENNPRKVEFSVSFERWQFQFPFSKKRGGEILKSGKWNKNLFSSSATAPRRRCLALDANFEVRKGEGEEKENKGGG